MEELTGITAAGPDDSVTNSGAVTIGVLVGFDTSGSPLVSYSTLVGESVVAMSTLPLQLQHVGRQVALLFAQGNSLSPVIMGVIHNQLQDLIDNYSPANVDSGESSSSDSIDSEVFDGETLALELGYRHSQETLHVDGKKIVIDAQDEIVLRCGDSSIRLSKDGKIAIRGKYLLSVSEGVHRIVGGVVQVN